MHFERIIIQVICWHCHDGSTFDSRRFHDKSNRNGIARNRNEYFAVVMLMCERESSSIAAKIRPNNKKICNGKISLISMESETVSALPPPSPLQQTVLCRINFRQEIQLLIAT